jgi:hypothetical protein
MADSRHKAILQLKRKVLGKNSLETLIKLRCKRLKLSPKAVESALLGGPAFLEATKFREYKGSTPLEQFLEAAVGLDKSNRMRGYVHLDNEEIRRYVLYELIPSERLQHYQACRLCQEHVAATRPSNRGAHEVD